MSARPTGPLREAHCHIGALGESLAQPSLASCATLGEMLASVRAWAAQAGAPGGFVRVRHARPLAWPEGRWPTLAELDEASGDVPVVVMSFDHHEAVASSAALAAADLRAGQRVGEAGVVEAGPDGLPTGLLREHAAYQAWDSAPPATGEQRLAQLRGALSLYARLGMTHVHDLRSERAMIEALCAMDLSGELDELGIAHIGLFPLVPDLDGALALVQATRPSRVRVLGGKVFVDGTINARTALMLRAYAQPLPGRPCGDALMSPAQLDDALRACDAHGLPLACHAIGDGAVRMVLDAVQRVRPRARGQRIEHAELVDPADAGRFVQLGVTASVQPCHLLTDVPALTRLLPHALERVLPLRSWLGSGLRPGALVGGLLFGSDAPIVRADPEDSIEGATRTLGGLNPGQELSAQQAWACFGLADG